MDFINIVSQTATPFVKKKLLYLHCVDIQATETIQLEVFSCLEVKLVLGHVSFPDKVGERRMCAFPMQQISMDRLKDRRSPVLIEVSNSCDIKSNGRTLAVIVDYKIVPNTHAVQVKPKEDYDEEDPLPTTPWLDVQLCNCNCSRYPNIGNILVNVLPRHNTTLENPTESGSESSDECSEQSGSEGMCASSDSEKEDLEGDDIDSDETPENFTEYFALKGSSYHEECQRALRKCKLLQLDKQQIDLRVNPEPANIQDKNAILVEAHLNGEWSRVGYIQKEKIRKVQAALQRNEINKVEFKSIGFTYITDMDDWLYQPCVLITKSRRWLQTDRNYKYNDNLHLE